MSVIDPAQKARIHCPNCHANNFVGHSQCWRCHVSLSGSALFRPVPVPPVAAGGARFLRLLLTLSLSLFVCVTIVIFYRLIGPASNDTENVRLQRTAPSETPFAPIAAPASGPTNPAPTSAGAQSTGVSQIQPSAPTSAPTSAVAPSSATSDTAPTPPRSPSQPTASAPQTTRETNTEAKPASPDSASDDPVINQARREIERAKSELILPPNAIGNDGQVHLRAGGVLSRDEWEAARRKLQQGSGEANPPSTAP